MKRRFIIEQLNKPPLERGARSVVAFRLYARGRTWSVARPNTSTSGKKRSIVRVIGATAALA
jgi:hypothetical protein